MPMVTSTTFGAFQVMLFVFRLGRQFSVRNVFSSSDCQAETGWFSLLR
jgi:hypothetical protein